LRIHSTHTQKSLQFGLRTLPCFANLTISPPCLADEEMVNWKSLQWKLQRVRTSQSEFHCRYCKLYLVFKTFHKLSIRKFWKLEFYASLGRGVWSKIGSKHEKWKGSMRKLTWVSVLTIIFLKFQIWWLSSNVIDICH
jgi:hypothetical protein